MKFLHVPVWTLAIWILVAFGVSSCTTSLSTQGIKAEDGTRIIRIEAERFNYNPSEIRVQKGELVRLIFTSRDTTHGVSIAEYHVRKDIPPRGKGETIVEFTADKVGSFTYRCSHLCGAGHAIMRGTMVVEP